MKTKIMDRSELRNVIVAWYNGAILCIYTPKVLDDKQRDSLRRMGFRWNKGKQYWEGSSFSKDRIVLRKVDDWGGVYLYTAPFEDADCLESAPEIAMSERLTRIMVKLDSHKYLMMTLN